MIQTRLLVTVFLLLQTVRPIALAEDTISRPFGHAPISDENLFPGETIKIRDVSLTWEYSNAPADATGSFGFLVARLENSPGQEVRQEILPMRYDPNLGGYGGGVRPPRPGISSREPRTPATWLGFIHIGDVVIRAIGSVKQFADTEAPVIQYLTLNSYFQPTIQLFNAASYPSMDVYVSTTSPLFLNEWELRVSEEPVELPDGGEHLQILVKNKLDGTEDVLPALAEIKRNYGRVKISVIESFPNSKVVKLGFSVEPDLNARGADAYTGEGIQIHGNETLEDFLEGMGERFGFEVEWVGHPEAPELVDRLKNIKARNDGRGYEQVVSWVIDQALSSALDHQYKETFDLQWVSPTHLRVFSLEIEKVLKVEEEAKRIAEENQKIKEDWEQNYQLQTRVYPLKTVTPVTAKALIDQKLNAYYFYDATRRGPGHRHSIRVQDNISEGPPDITKKYVEQAVADEKANAVIVTAIPKTHEKIEKLLAEMDAMLGEKEQTSIPARYRLQVILLKGMQQPDKSVINGNSVAEARTESVSEEIESNKEGAGLDTVVESMTVSDQLMLEFAALLSEYGKININVEPNVYTYVTYNLQNPKPIRQILEDISKIYGVGIDYQPGLTVIRKHNRSVETSKGIKLTNYGISEEDLEIIGLQSAVELGRGVVDLAGAKGEEGEAFLSLTGDYAFEFEYLDLREPYLIAKGRFLDKEEDQPLLENTLYLEPDKPSLLGLTNLRDALILLVKRLGG